MFASNSNIILAIAISGSMAFVVAAVWFVNRILIKDTQELLVRYILLVFTALIATWIIDKVVAFRTKLLTDEQSAQLWELIKYLMTTIFGYYFGTKKGEK